MIDHPAPWRFVDGGDDLAELFDKTNAFICPVPLSVADRIVKAVNVTLCGWHAGTPPCLDGESCQNCGKLLATKLCDGCQHAFLDWSAQGGDDIVGAPRVTEGGDLCCARCAAQHADDDELWDEWDEMDDEDEIDEETMRHDRDY